MDKEKHMANWTELTKVFDGCPIKVKGFALVAVGDDNEVYWGASFKQGALPILRHLDKIRKDINRYITEYGSVTAVQGHQHPVVKHD